MAYHKFEWLEVCQYIYDTLHTVKLDKETKLPGLNLDFVSKNTKTNLFYVLGT